MKTFDPPPPGRPSELLDPAVLQRYLLLLSLEVEAERMIKEHWRQIAEIDRAHALKMAKTEA